MKMELRLAIVALTVAVAVLGKNAVLAQSAPPRPAPATATPALPTLVPCEANAAAPALPKLWRAVALLFPYTTSQLDIAELIYDGTVPALRATVTGAESGSVDLLITSEQTWQLTGPREAPNACVALGRAFKLPTERWLSPQAQCVGRTSVSGNAIEGWRMPAGQAANPSATWFWYRGASRLPWRAMFTELVSDPPVIGEYSLSYFPTFEAIPRSNLGALRDMCRARATAATPPSASGGVRALMTASQLSDDERARRIQTMMPGFSRRACTGMQPYDWPKRFHMTAIMTPTTFGYGPYPSEIFYDWEGTKSMLTRMRNPAAPQSPESIDALLVNDSDGYDIRRPAGVASACSQPYPGVIRPDWMRHDKCQCRGVITNNATFGAKDTVQILSCPIEHESTFWAIYRTNGAPVTFRSTAVNPGGLTLADYHHWRPGAAFPADVLKVPEQCTGTAAMFARPNFFERANTRGQMAQRCSGCHLVGN